MDVHTSELFSATARKLEKIFAGRMAEIQTWRQEGNKLVQIPKEEVIKNMQECARVYQRERALLKEAYDTLGEAAPLQESLDIGLIDY